VNPKALVFFVAFLPQFADAGAGAFRQMLLLGLLVALCSMLVNGILAVLVAPAGDSIVRSSKVARSQRWITTGVLALLAVRIVV
jgi:threonine/homoserine/homoserine lactone efflux protein